MRWKNLLSTGNYFTEIKLNNKTNTLVVGENGSGKSTMLDALCFGLFGKAFRNVNKPNLLNSINNKDCVVEIEFDTSNKSYKIIRGIKPNKFEIFCDGELLNQDAAARDYQDYLEKFILKLNYKSFTQIVILGSASFTPFMQLSPADRRAIIEELLDIQIFSSMNSILKDRMAVNKEHLSEGKLKTDNAKSKIEMQEKHIEDMKQNNQELILSYQSEVSNNEIEISKLNTSISETQNIISELQQTITDKAEIQGKIKKLTQLEAQIETNVGKFKKDIQFFEGHDVCPTCHQGIGDEFKQEQIGNLGTKVNELQTGLSTLEVKLSDLNIRLGEIANTVLQVQNCQTQVAISNSTITELNKYNGKLSDKIEALRNTKDTTKKTELALQILQGQLLEEETKLQELNEEKIYLEAASNLLKDTGIKTKIIRQYLPIINKLVNKYLASFDFFVNFNLDETFKETIKSRHRDDFSYASFSEGEKQKIDLALLFSWRAVAKLKNSANTNLLILDEVFDSSLDANGTEYLMNILHMLEGTNVFVISHKGDILQDKFRSVIRFEKVKNFSRIMK